MRLSGIAAERYCRTGPPDGEVPVGVLLYGNEAGHVAEQRRRLVDRLAVDDPDIVTRFEASDIRRDPAALHDTLRSTSLFRHQKIVLVTGATDNITQMVEEALEGLDRGSITLIIEAGALTTRSSLRKLFEHTQSLIALAFRTGLEPDPQSIARSLQDAGLVSGVTDEAMAFIAAHAADADHGSFARTIEAIALFGLNAAEPLSASEISKLLPLAVESETDKLISALVAGRVGEVCERLSRLRNRGMSDVTIAMQVSGFLGQLLNASLTGSVDTARPPVYGPRRDYIEMALARWQSGEIEDALRNLHETDLTLRSGAGHRPTQALLERALLKFAVSARDLAR